VGALENASGKQQSSVATVGAAAAARPAPVSATNTLVWVAFALGLASAIPGLVLGLFGLPFGVAAAAVSAVALARLTNNPPDQRRGELLTLLSLGIGVFQIVFALVAFLFVNLA
jgi:hypothetical protein